MNERSVLEVRGKLYKSRAWELLLKPQINVNGSNCTSLLPQNEA